MEIRVKLGENEKRVLGKALEEQEIKGKRQKT